MSCAELTLAAQYCLGELPEADREAFEEHYFGCDACLRRTRAMQRLVAQLELAVPTVLTEQRRRGLEARHPHMPTVSVQPGGRARIRLGGDAVVGLWVMQAPLGGATQVNVEARTADGGLVFALADVPFDAQRGEIVLACQDHYRVMPAQELHVRVTVTLPGGPVSVGEYILDHEFESL